MNERAIHGNFDEKFNELIRYAKRQKGILRMKLSMPY